MLRLYEGHSASKTQPGKNVLNTNIQLVVYRSGYIKNSYVISRKGVDFHADLGSRPDHF